MTRPAKCCGSAARSLAPSPVPALALTLVASMSGCSVVEPSEPPPIDWLRDAQLGAAVPMGAGGEPASTEPELRSGTYPLDLRSVLKLAGSKPLDIRRAQLETSEAEAVESAAQGQYLPALSPRLSFVRHEGVLQDTRGAFLDVDKQNQFAGGGVGLRVDLADAFYESLAAAQRVRARRLGVRASRHTSVAAAVSLYYRLLQEAGNRQIAERAVNHAQALVDVEGARVREGQGLKAQELRAQAFLAAAEGQLAAIEARVAAHSAELGALLLLPDDFGLAPVDEIVPIEFPEADRPVTELVGRAMQNRPDLHSALADVDALAAERAHARYDWLIPELEAEASYGAFGNNLGSTDDRQDYFVGVVWDWQFGDIARSRVRDARQRQAEVDVERLRRDIRAAILSARARVTSARARVAAAQRELQAAEAAHELVSARHRQGEVLLVELLDAVRARTEAAYNFVRAVTESNLAQFELRLQVGGVRE